MDIQIGINEANQRLDRFIRKTFKNNPLSSIFKDIRRGTIKVNDKKKPIKYMLALGDVVNLSDDYVVTLIKLNLISEIEYSKPKVCYEDKNVLIVIKNENVLVHGDNINNEITLTDNVLLYLNKKGEYYPEKEIIFSPSPCNRLDRNTSGLVIFGKNSQSLIEINELIRNRKIRKFYLALISGKIKDGKYDAIINKNNAKNISKTSLDLEEDGKDISMYVTTLETSGMFSLVEIELFTGRSHQIRSHLKSLGNFIVGDPKYGSIRINNTFYNKYKLKNQLLFGHKLVFPNLKDTYLSEISHKTVVMPEPTILKKIAKDIFKLEI